MDAKETDKILGKDYHSKFNHIEIENINRPVLVQDGGVEGHTFINSCESTKIAVNFGTTINGRYCNPPKKDITHVQRQSWSCSETIRGAQSWWNQIPYPLGGWPTNWRIIIFKKFSHCCEGSEPRIRLLSLGIWQRNWESPGNLIMKASRIWLQVFHRTEGNKDSSLGGCIQTLAHTKTQKKGAVTQWEIEPELPAIVGGSPVEAWGSRG